MARINISDRPNIFDLIFDFRPYFRLSTLFSTWFSDFWFRPDFWPFSTICIAQAGCRKCDFFVKQEYYNIFLSQIPALQTHQSITLSPSSSRISEIIPNQGSITSNKKRKVESKLSLEGEFRNIADKFKGSEYIEFEDSGRDWCNFGFLSLTIISENAPRMLNLLLLVYALSW